ncbi:hypothetical protein [Paenibacillus sp. MMO-58]|uniref:hypothetical protein n=1 Tax=Paenibacillus sp. MMO-58 TaxID=3081290 RepID=UPI0030193445
MAVGKDELNLNLLENGLDFIRSSITYLSRSKEKNNIKYAILHLSAGVDLILKYKLSLEHWSLLFQKIDSANREDFHSGNFKSVDSKECVERLASICGIVLNEQTKKNFTHLRDRRNRLEHFEINESVLALKSSSMKVLNSILDFINDQLSEEDLEEYDDLLRNIRIGLRDFREFIDKRMKLLAQDISEHKKNAPVTNCPSCYQEALCISDESRCLFCGYRETDAEKLANEYIWEILDESEYECVKNGGEYPLYSCIECGHETMVHLFPYIEDKGWICFSCGCEWASNDINFCNNCGQTFRNIHGNSVCRECIEYRLDKDD